MRESDLLHEGRAFFERLNEDKSIIGTSKEFIESGGSSYLQCKTLLTKETKNAARIVNMIKHHTGREPVKEKDKGFTYLLWQYFFQDK